MSSTRMELSGPLAVFVVVLVLVALGFCFWRHSVRTPHHSATSTPHDDDVFSAAVSQTQRRARPSLRRARAVGIELACDRGGHLAEVIEQHISPRHNPTPRTAHIARGNQQSSMFSSAISRDTLREWVAGTLRAPSRIVGDADNTRRVLFYREWDCIVGSTGGDSGAMTSVVKVVVHMSAAAGGQPHVITAYPCQGVRRCHRDILLDDSEGN